MGLTDGITIVVATFGLAFLAVFLYASLAEGFKITTPMLANMSGNATFANEIETNTLTGINMFDAAVGIFVGGLIISAVIAAYITRSYPFLAVFSILFQGIVIIIGWMLSGVFKNFIFGSIIVDYASHFPITQFVMGNLAIIAMLASAAIIVATYIKPVNAAGYG